MRITALLPGADLCTRRASANIQQSDSPEGFSRAPARSYRWHGSQKHHTQAEQNQSAGSVPHVPAHQKRIHEIKKAGREEEGRKPRSGHPSVPTLRPASEAPSTPPAAPPPGPVTRLRAFLRH